MIRVDGAYLYDTMNAIRKIASIPDQDITRFNLFFEISGAREAIKGLVFESILSPGFHVVHKSAHDLLEKIDGQMPNLSDTSTFDIDVPSWTISDIKRHFVQFEAILRAELQAMALYVVSPKGGFDNKNLIDNGSQLFPTTLDQKVPEAMIDALTGARCLAFELWTAMGFHFHRANEAVLRRYYDTVIGTRNRPKNLTMGTILSSMEQHDVGDKNIRAALKNITVFHRNPLAHPEHHLADGDEAIALYAAVRAAIGYMLEKLTSATTAPPQMSIAEAVPPVITVPAPLADAAPAT